MKYTLRVVLNGTNTNPYHKMGLTQNPFPQLGKKEFEAAERIVASLGGDPIPDTAYIRERLKGFSPEFVEICCLKFRKGERVEFDVAFGE